MNCYEGMKFAHKFGVRSSLKTYFQKFLPPPKIGKKTQNFADRRWSEAHTSKWLKTSTNNRRFIYDKCAKTVPNLGASLIRSWCNLWGKLMMHKKLCISNNSAKFPAARPHFQHIIFRPQWPLPLALIVWGCSLPKVFGDWKYALNYGKDAYSRLGNVWRAALLAIVPDNCHLYS